MPKTITGDLSTHLGLETTSLTTLWRITRTDGIEFFFTDHDVDVPFEGDVYVAAVGYDRTAVSNQVGLSVDNLDVTGFLDSSALTDGDLRAGLFDFAEVHVSLVNFNNISDGALKMRRGKLGEIVYTDGGVFETELRGLTQAYSQQIVELYEPECRVDLGDSRCKIELFPDVLLRNTAYTVGDVVRVSEVLVGIAEATLLVPGDTDENDISDNEAVGTLGSQAQIQVIEKQFGVGSVEFSPSSPTGSTLAFLQYPDIAVYSIGASEFTIECWVRFDDLTQVNQIIASHYKNTGNQRAWRILRSGDSLNVFLSDDGSSTAPALSIVGSFTWIVDTWYHVAVTRDSSDDVRLFVNGTQIGSTTSVTFAIHDSTAPLNLGRFLSIPDQLPMNGFIDDFRLVVGDAAYTGGFTPPVAAHPIGPSTLIPGLTTTDFDDRVFTVTIAGTTSGIQPSFDITPGNDTVDGGVTFTAAEAFTKAGIVSAVIDNRTFSVTFPEGVDSRDVLDWFKYGAVNWETGNNAFTNGLTMEVKKSTPILTTDTATIAVDDTSTFSRIIGSFLDDGFQIGMNITTSGFTDGANNGTFTVQSVAATILNTVETTLVAESGTGDETIISDEFISLFLSMPFVVQVGDILNIYAGCDKRFATCKDKFNNAVNFRGEPFVPGQDAFIAVRVPR